MKKILVVFTGGTIGSSAKGKEINVDKSRSYFLIDRFFEKYDIKAEFDVVQPLNILSENSTNKSLELLMNELLKVDFDKYAGVIITHGSDTLPYTSAMTGFVLSGVRIPVILVASNYELTNPLSNGLRNFAAAVQFIYNEKIPGIFTIFENSLGEMRVYISTRIVEATPYDDQFSGYAGKDFGEIKNGKLLIEEYKGNPSLDEVIKYAKGDIAFKSVEFKNDIMFIRPFPGLDYSFFDFSKRKPKAILHGLYHSSTACAEDGGEGKYNSLAEFIKKCKEEEIDVYLAPFRSPESELYASSNILLESGGIPLCNTTIEAALMKLLLVYNIDVAHPKEMMNACIYMENNSMK